MRRFAPYLAVIALSVLVSALLPAPKSEAQPDVGEIARATGIRVLGATRGYATTGLWLRAGAAYDRGDLYETLAAYQLIRELQPRNPAVYSYLAWNQAYNISAQFPEVERREYWVTLGLKTLHEGQDRLPRDASLRMDEWHFLLNRSISYPGAILNVEIARYEAPAWQRLCEIALERQANLTQADRAALNDFLENYGLQLNLFDTADAYAENGDFSPLEHAQMRALFALPASDQGFLALAHWCRLHAMFLAILPALELRPHSLTIEAAILNTSLLANGRIPPGIPAQEFEREYKEAVAKAFVSGIENAHRTGGEKAAEEFLDDVKYNFRNQPELLPPEVIDRAFQEIQE